MKHAYLIIAHHEFEILKKLVQAIDDERNDIYIHIDKKVKFLPFVRTSQSNLMILTNRVDVRWGDLSQLRAEYALLEAAYKQNRQYAYYHILSGVHLPLYPQKYIHAFFDNQQHKDVLQPMGTSDEEILLKIRRYNLFVRHFQNPNRIIIIKYKYLIINILTTSTSLICTTFAQHLKYIIQNEVLYIIV